MKTNHTIAECFARFRVTRNPLYFVKAVKILISQRRFIEAAYGLYCQISLHPSVISSHSSFCTHSYLDEKLKKMLFYTKDLLSREDIVHVFGQKYAVDCLPADFCGARIEAISFSGSFLIIGEYGNPGKRIAVTTEQSCAISEYYEAQQPVRHIHSICSFSDAGLLLISTGDTAKYLDIVSLRRETIDLVSRIRKSLAGYTAMLRINDTFFLGTDFSGRPNYLEIYDGKTNNNMEKIPFPEKAYNMFVLRLMPFKKGKNQHIVCLSREISHLGGRHALSVFDVERKKFVFCDHVQYCEPIAADRTLHIAAIRLRSNGAGECDHPPPKTRLRNTLALLD